MEMDMSKGVALVILLEEKKVVSKVLQIFFFQKADKKFGEGQLCLCQSLGIYAITWKALTVREEIVLL